MGYESSPLVEDEGTFSVGGGIFDIFCPLCPRPARLEFLGDTMESIRAFDPQTQRTVDSLESIYLIPARELLFTPSTQKAAEASTRSAAERVTTPTSKVRERLEQIREGIPAFGMEPLLPGFFEGGLSTVFDYLPFWSKDPVFYLDDSVALDRVAGELWSELSQTFEAAEKRTELTRPPDEHFLRAEEVESHLDGRRTILGGGLSLPDPARLPVVVHFGGSYDPLL